MNRLAIAATVLFIVGISSPSFADVDVVPDPSRPRLILDGTKTQPSDLTKPEVPISINPAPTSPTASKEPTFDPVVSCRTDPVIGIYGCRTDSPAEPELEADRPEVTPGDVLRAVRKIGLPSLQLKVQPGAKTLVNVETIFFTEPQPFERSVELLGFDVDLAAEPVGYQWIHGDGTTATTTAPGRPYPAMDVVHRYTSPADDVQARVDVTYRVRFRVDGGPWQTIGQTLLAAGPPTPLDVDEAAPVLTRP